MFSRAMDFSFFPSFTLVPYFLFSSYVWRFPISSSMGRFIVILAYVIASTLLSQDLGSTLRILRTCLLIGIGSPRHLSSLEIEGVPWLHLKYSFTFLHNKSFVLSGDHINLELFPSMGSFIGCLETNSNLLCSLTHKDHVVFICSNSTYQTLFCFVVLFILLSIRLILLFSRCNDSIGELSILHFLCRNVSSINNNVPQHRVL